MVSIPDPAGPWFPGIDRPNYTQFPNVLLERVMHRVSHAEWKVVCLVVRWTKGWHDEDADIPLDEIVRGTGISRSGVKLAVASLARQGVLVSKRNTAPNGGSLPTTYGLRYRKRDQPVASGEATGWPPGGSTTDHPFPIEERNPVKETILTEEKDNDPAAIWSATLDQLRDRGVTASNLGLLADLPVSINQGTLVIRCAVDVADRWGGYIRLALAGRPVRFARQ